ncbi:MAG: GIY-YIG nuclease family protein [Chitinophagaceae bacterium]|nr:GIY-YIG nuclease family protein [Chitinophagaceae bacterium]
MPFYTYILKSLKDNGYYYGHTKDLSNRLLKHNTGKVRSTKSRTPFILHYQEEFDTKSVAYLRELYFKSVEGKKYLYQKGII